MSESLYLSNVELILHNQNPSGIVYSPNYWQWFKLSDLHEKTQLDCIKTCVESGVKALMSMDNLDTMFHPPDYAVVLF
ncbi:MAG: hypothetical protein A2X04_04330 [Bacteroidetes bacterium GWF2_41_9]|nr:MAG: hypothetical protein A2X03_01270 [Bacteroidetes bacterium GWA2_40_15]OFX95715.1 MAG: hypothetical protein A2X06_07220 [Bacteroidetes bacterium GWC2_40_22]OFY60955.1 MAG: hypothetical protein A2X04_04330 [Bacteroidetes bacterium GWF2_41_9]HAM09399.1 hypothetical protein [Bacteroidales bacterium]HBH83426.1 hypothetical protein [Bacteroidales bacterium]